jgi:hypothetical protein
MNTFFAVILLVSSLTLNPVILGIFKIEKDVSLFLLSIVVFAGPNTTEHFCQWLFSGESEGTTAIAHNFKGYDSLPILEYLYQNGMKPTIIANGAKNMYI